MASGRAAVGANQHFSFEGGLSKPRHPVISDERLMWPLRRGPAWAGFPGS